MGGRRRVSVESQITAGFGLALLLFLVLGAISYRSVAQLTMDAVAVKNASEVQRRLEALQTAVTDAETGQSDFTITGDDSFLEPLQNAGPAIDAEVRELRRLIVDPGQQRKLERLVPIMAERLQLARGVVELQRARGFEAARARAASSHGKAIHDRIRRSIEEMRLAQEGILHRREQKTRATAQFTLISLGAGAGLALVGLGAAQHLVQRQLHTRRRMEEAVQEANAALRLQADDLTVATGRAEASDRIKSAFLATMSHELRTPLNSIIGFTGILLQGLPGPLNPEQKRQLGMVQGSARHLLALINDVLDISKIEAGELAVHAAPFDLRASIDKVAAIVKPLAETKGLALGVEMAPEIGTLANDRRRVEQVLLNLLNNAVKFTEDGKVGLTARMTESWIEIAVADTGIGIRPEDLGTLFQPFRQVDAGLSRNHEGTGLGLAICLRLAELMGGEIRVASVWGQGSEFTLALPLSKASPS